MPEVETVKSCESCIYWHERLPEDKRKVCTAHYGWCKTHELENWVARACTNCDHFNGLDYCMEYAQPVPFGVRDCPVWAKAKRKLRRWK